MITSLLPTKSDEAIICVRSNNLIGRLHSAECMGVYTFTAVKRKKNKKTISKIRFHLLCSKFGTFKKLINNP